MKILLVNRLNDRSCYLTCKWRITHNTLFQIKCYKIFGISMLLVSLVIILNFLKCKPLFWKCIYSDSLGCKYHGKKNNCIICSRNSVPNAAIVTSSVTYKTKEWFSHWFPDWLQFDWFSLSLALQQDRLHSMQWVRIRSVTSEPQYLWISRYFWYIIFTINSSQEPSQTGQSHWGLLEISPLTFHWPNHLTCLSPTPGV